jgi:hypothetical protein
MSGRRDEVFHVLKVIRRIVDETHDPIERAIQGAGTDRAYADAAFGHLQPTVDTSAAEKLHTLCRQLIDERETLAKVLEEIQRELDLVDIVPRGRDLGRGARGTGHKKGGTPL